MHREVNKDNHPEVELGVESDQEIEVQEHETKRRKFWKKLKL